MLGATEKGGLPAPELRWHSQLLLHRLRQTLVFREGPVLRQLLATNDLTVQIADYKLQLGGTDSIFLLAGACIQATTAFSTFASALSVQGQNGGGSQQHDVWHDSAMHAVHHHLMAPL